MISHFWGMKKLEDGKIADYHGKKVGVATLMLVEAYRNLILRDDVSFKEDDPDWNAVYSAYGENFRDYVKEMNVPSATEGLSPALLEENWCGICRIIDEELPTADELRSILLRAGAATEISEIDIDKELALSGLLYHPYMRHKIILSRLLPMTNITIDSLIEV